MRNFKKVMALAISVAAVCTSVSAFAELDYNVTGDVTGTYDKAANALTLNVEGAAGDKTVLVLDNGIEATNAIGENILYINQYTAEETAYTTMKLKGETALAAGTYAVKIGYTDGNGDFAIKNASIVVAEKQPDEPQFVTIEVWGDTNDDGDISALDISVIVSQMLGSPETERKYVVGEVVPGTEVVWGDTNDDGDISALDISVIVSQMLGSPETERNYVVGESAQLPIVSE